MTDFKIHHLGVAVAKIADALPFYQRAFGSVVVSGPFEDPLQKVTVCFIGRGADDPCLIELIEPLGQDSPINRMLAKQIGAYHICYEVDEAAATLAAMCAQGCVPVCDPVPAVAFGGRRIAWFFTPTNQLVEVVERAQVNAQSPSPSCSV